MQRRVLIATLAYSGQITSLTAQSVDQAKEEGRDNGWEVRWMILNGTADIADMRNQALGLFLNTPCDDLLFVDADVSWSPGTFAHIMRHDVDVVAGLYRERTDGRVKYPWLQQGSMIENPVSGLPLLEAEAVPAGFLRLKRDGVEKLAGQYDTRWIQDDAKLKGICYPFLFDWTWNGNRRLSEDYTYCHRWRAIGGQVWVDPALKLDHIGQKVFVGDFMGHLHNEAMAQVSSLDPKAMAEAALAL